MRRHLLLRSGGRVGRAAGEHLVRHQPQGVEISPVIDARIGSHLLRRHVGRRAERHAGAGQPLSAGGVAHRLGDAEIHHQRVAVGEEDVLRLDVSVHHPGLVSLGQRVGDLPGQPDDLGHRQRSGPGEPLAERLALHERHHVVVEHLRAGPVGDDARVQQADDVRMLQLRGDPDLLEEALGTEGSPQLRPQHLDRDFAIVLKVLRQIHRGHAALAQLALDQVAVAQSVGEARVDCGHNTACRG